MYIPRANEEKRLPVLHELIVVHPLASLVTLGSSGLLASHIPMVLEQDGSEFGVLKCHISRANTQARDLVSTVDALAIFSGPQQYISASWYPGKLDHGKEVPTWNYAVVHAYGPLLLREDPTWLMSHLESLTHIHEAASEQPWKVSDAPPDFIQTQLRGIIGLEIPIRRLEGKWKTSQNRTERDRLAVSEGLAQRKHPRKPGHEGSRRPPLAPERHPMSLFDTSPLATPAASKQTPLAERMRPTSLDEYVGQQHLLGPGKPLRLAIETDDPTSMIFWGPPGTGKTTLAKIIATLTNASFIEFSAVLSGIKEIKAVMVDAEKASSYGSRTILFVDEIHRFNKAQQDAFLPYVERGTIRLIGATTENPSFELNAALLSRCRVYTLVGLEESQVIALLHRALADPRSRPRCKPTSRPMKTLWPPSPPTPAATPATLSTRSTSPPNWRTARARSPSRRPSRPKPSNAASCSTTRRASSITTSSPPCTSPSATPMPTPRSTGSPRMLEAGEDPMYVARRVVRMAVEDIGLAAPEALNLCLSARDAMHFLGQPEGGLALRTSRGLPRPRA